ncbi:MAG: LacI family DNA-binding transcriptional regulator, partial [Actinomycetota bacterium]|nr:LacI family DNA-binding transcriptional regulator [Actinomycetota bacterium]
MAGLSEIASAAGVSMATVSRVLNRRSGVGEQTRARVLAVLADLPYTPRGLG